MIQVSSGHSECLLAKQLAFWSVVYGVGEVTLHFVFDVFGSPLSSDFSLLQVERCFTVKTVLKKSV